MRYTSYSAFEKHCDEAAQLSSCYFVSCSCEPDRKIILDKIVQKFSKNCEIKRFPSAKIPTDLLPLVREMTLFDSVRLFVVQETELEAEVLSFLQTAPLKTHFLLGLISGKEPKSIYEMIKHGANWLDLSREKPWEREKRLMITLREQVLRVGKTVAPDLIERLIHLVGSDWQRLEREIEKLLAFIGKRHEIVAADLDLTVAGLKELSSWQIAEEIVWGTRGFPVIPLIETSDFLALIGTLRYQIQLGWQMASTAMEALPQYFKPYQIQKYGKLAHAKQIGYFEKALLGLYQMETRAKSTSLDPRLLITQFAGHLREE